MLTAWQEAEALRRATLIVGVLGRDAAGKLDAKALETNATASVYAAILFLAGPQPALTANPEVAEIVERIMLNIRRELAQL